MGWGSLAALAQVPRAIPVSPLAPPPRAESAAAFDASNAGGASEGRMPAPSASGSNVVINSAAGDYVLSNSDTLEMSIYREPDLTTRSRIASDGTVQLPLIGDIHVSGMTIRDARELIRKRYDADYLVEPQIHLNLVEYSQRKFTILGQVVKPGSFEFPGGRPLSLLEAVGIAGGFTRSADRGKVIVKRTTAGGAEGTIKVNVKKLQSDSRQSFNVLPGDVINVGESWF